MEGKAAFNNFPYQYGVVERTFSEYKSGQLVLTRVADYATLPPDLQAGAIQEAYTFALAAGTGGPFVTTDTAAALRACVALLLLQERAVP